MAGGINQIEHVSFAIICLIINTHRIGFDCDAALAFDIHRVKQLLFHIAVFDGSGFLNQTVCQSGFSMVDMRHNGKVSNFVKLCHN